MNLELGEFVVMPNHFRGIKIIGDNQYNNGGDATHNDGGRDAMCCVSTDEMNETDNTTDTNKPANQFGPQSKNLGSIIRGYKSAVTTYARKGNVVFDWQPRFHDHIICSMDEYYRISNYIINNPAKWKDDKFNKK